MAHLTLVLQGREVRKFALNPGITTIGRAQDNDIVINNLALSRRHAQVERRAGRYEVSDLASQNGVFVNSERVRGARVLENADTITLGTYHFVFNDTPAEEPEIRSVRPRKDSASGGEVTEHGAKPKQAAGESGKDDAEHVPLLVLKYNDVELQRFPLRNKSCLIGRAKECDVQIAERRLSRKHCEIMRNDGNRFFVKDLGSQNGTYVNRKRIREFYQLQHGDVLNFAEYAVLYLSDLAAYNGPDLVHARRQAAQTAKKGSKGPGPRPDSRIEAEETEFPEAYDDDADIADAPSIVPGGDHVQPSEMDEDPDDARGVRMPMSMMPEPPVEKSEPFIEPPRLSRERRKQQQPRRAIRERVALTGSAPKAGDERERVRAIAAKKSPRVEPPAGARSGKKGERATAPRRDEHDARDVPDEQGDVRPDPSLEAWYDAREEKSAVLEDEDSSVLLSRGKSSVSRILSTMMVDKRDLDRNLSVKARQRKFSIEVRHGGERAYSGPLAQPVTILGTDKEADIQLKGRYVAGRHSILVRVRDSLLLVRLGSSSAARVNGLPKLQAFLKDGDLIQIDETTIRISED